MKTMKKILWALIITGLGYLTYTQFYATEEVTPSSDSTAIDSVVVDTVKIDTVKVDTIKK